MTTTQWLLGFHLVGAFLFVSGAVAVGLLRASAVWRERPSEVAFLLGLTRWAVAAVGLGALAALAFGTSLVRRSGFSFGDAWISASLALWIASVLLGGFGGRSARHARYLAEELAAAGDAPSEDLRLALKSPASQSLSYASFLATLAILALMVWRPGA